jgi:acyl carrier protein
VEKQLMAAIDPRLKATVLRTLKLDDWDLDTETLAHEVPGWDSLSHVNLICEVEREFGIRFRPSEVVQLENVGDLDALVRSKDAELREIRGAAKRS